MLQKHVKAAKKKNVYKNMRVQKFEKKAPLAP